MSIMSFHNLVQQHVVMEEVKHHPLFPPAQHLALIIIQTTTWVGIF
jgi:hypothetical protein